MHQNDDHRARYDAEGNIIIEPYLKPKENTSNKEALVGESQKKHKWRNIDENAPEPLLKPQSKYSAPRIHHSEKKGETIDTSSDIAHTRDVVENERTDAPSTSVLQKTPVLQNPSTKDEAKMQENTLLAGVQSVSKTGKAAWKDVETEVRNEVKSLRSTISSLRMNAHEKLVSSLSAMRRPITIPGKKRRKKERNAATQFLIDSVRFGGTFAAIFVVLFSAMNYQSFLQIAKAQLALGSEIETEQALTSLVDEPQKAQTVKNVERLEGALLSYLPGVGPHENRIIIPKIGKNLPVVQPSMEGLLREDWKQFEEDIQDALLDGVVHYPGSAKPGRAGNAFFTAHSSYFAWSRSKHKDDFARLGDLQIGDVFSLYYNGDKYTYRVNGKREVKPSDVSVLDQPTDRRTATLMTCTPVGTTLRRLIVTADEIHPETGNIVAVTERVGEKASVEKLQHKIEMLPI